LSPGWSDPAFAKIAEILQRRTGLSFGPGREAAAEAGIRRAMQRSGVLDPGRYLGVVEASPDALHDLTDDLTVGETYFFRHPDQLEILRSRIMPELLRARPPDHVFRVWSAGCATGEEPYTLAILLHELGLGERAHILATDVSREALARARRGVYKAWSFRGSPEERRRAHFVEEQGQLAVRPRYRRCVAFEHGNLALDTYPSIASGIWGLDLIFCRNVILYFAPETIRAVARRLHAALAPGGFLVMGPSDAPLWQLAPFETLTTPAGIVYRRPAHDRPQPGSKPPAAAPVRAPPEARADIDAPRPRRESARSAPVRPPPAPPPPADDPRELAAGVRSIAAHRGARAAEQACAEATLRHPLSVELSLLRTLLLLELGRLDEAAEAARRTLYLDPRSPIAHFTAATIARRSDDPRAARRGYRNAQALAAALDPDTIVPLTEGERAGRLADAAAVQLALLDDRE
jgi:chemotaxis protein methyltransferase CheR